MRDLNNSFYNYAIDLEVKSFQSFWAEIDSAEQQMYAKIYTKFSDHVQKKGWDCIPLSCESSQKYVLLLK